MSGFKGLKKRTAPPLGAVAPIPLPFARDSPIVKNPFKHRKERLDPSDFSLIRVVVGKGTLASHLFPLAGSSGSLPPNVLLLLTSKLLPLCAGEIVPFCVFLRPFGVF